LINVPYGETLAYFSLKFKREIGHLEPFWRRPSRQAKSFGSAAVSREPERLCPIQISVIRVHPR
jgi:hypothetical protein